MIKFIASDMDGTLLNSRRKIDSEFFDLLNTLEQKNITMAFASGRNLQSLKRLIPKNLQDKIMYISNNGAQITYKDEIIYQNTIPLKYICEISKLTKDIKNTKRLVFLNGNIYCNSILNILGARFIGFKQKYKKNINNISSEPTKYSIISSHATQQKILEKLEPLKDQLTIVPSGRNIVDIMNKDVNKGNAIKFVQDKYSILYEETMVFGDYLNDLEMMDSAYYSFAMINGHSQLKEKARFIAGHHNKKGVIEAIKERIK